MKMHTHRQAHIPISHGLWYVILALKMYDYLQCGVVERALTLLEIKGFDFGSIIWQSAN